MRDKTGKQDEERKDCGEIEPFVYVIFSDFDNYSEEEKSHALEQARDLERGLMDRALNGKYSFWAKFSDETKAQKRREIQDRERYLKQLIPHWLTLTMDRRERLLAGTEPQEFDLLTAEESRKKSQERMKKGEEPILKSETGRKSGRNRGRPAKDPVTLKALGFLRDKPDYNLDEKLDACKDHKSVRALGADLHANVFRDEVPSPNRLKIIQSFVRGRKKSRDQSKAKNP